MCLSLFLVPFLAATRKSRRILGLPEPLWWVSAGFAWTFFWVGFPNPSLATGSGERVVRGCLTQDAEQGPRMEWVVLAAEIDGSSHGTVRIGIPGSRLAESLGQGDCLTVTATLGPYPGESSVHMFGNGFLPIDLEGILRPWDRLSVSKARTSGITMDRLFSGARKTLSGRFERLFSPDVAGTLSAMVLSDTSRLSPELTQTFRSSGVFHLLSVSGEHMALLGTFVTGVVFLLLGLVPDVTLRQVYVRVPVGGILGILVLLVMGLYLGLIGAPLPAQRAFLGLALFFVARTVRPAWSWNDVFGLSVLVLMCADPLAPLSLSFDLSLSALMGLVFYLDRTSRAKAESGGEEYQGNRERFREAFRAGVFITATTSPLLWLCFRQFDWVGIVSNGIVVPLAGDILLPAGFVYAGILGFFPHGWILPTEILEALGRSVLGLVTFFSRLPHGQIPMPALSPAAFITLWGAIGSLLGRNASVKQGTVLLSATAILVLVALTEGQPKSLVPDRALGPGVQAKWIPSYDVRTEANNVKWMLGI